MAINLYVRFMAVQFLDPIVRVGETNLQATRSGLARMKPSRSARQKSP